MVSSIRGRRRSYLVVTPSATMVQVSEAAAVVRRGVEMAPKSVVLQKNSKVSCWTKLIKVDPRGRLKGARASFAWYGRQCGCAAPRRRRRGRCRRVSRGPLSPAIVTKRYHYCPFTPVIRIVFCHPTGIQFGPASGPGRGYSLDVDIIYCIQKYFLLHLY